MLENLHDLCVLKLAILLLHDSQRGQRCRARFHEYRRETEVGRSAERVAVHAERRVAVSISSSDDDISFSSELAADFCRTSRLRDCDVVDLWFMGIPLMFALKDVILKQSAPTVLMTEKHAEFIISYLLKKHEYEYVMGECIQMSGLYWCLTALDILGLLDQVNRAEVIDFIRQCWRESGGFAASADNDAHLLHTLSAIQILVTLNRLDIIDKERVVHYIQQRQNEDGSFSGDEWGEVDTRFSFCAVAALALLNRLNAIDLNKAVDYVLQCKNFDGGFGSLKGSESHAGQIYCCIGTLSIANELNRLDADQLGWWLCERQCASGRPEKLPDVCYSWWVLSSLAIIGRIEWIDETLLRKFILASQDEETGGFSDRPDDMPDPFHTLFGLGGLSLLGETSVKRVNPVFCMAEERLRTCALNLQYLHL